MKLGNNFTCVLFWTKRVTLFPNFTRHYLITHTNYLLQVKFMTKTGDPLAGILLFSLSKPILEAFQFPWKGIMARCSPLLLLNSFCYNFACENALRIFEAADPWSWENDHRPQKLLINMCFVEPQKGIHLGRGTKRSFKGTVSAGIQPVLSWADQKGEIHNQKYCNFIANMYFIYLYW